MNLDALRSFLAVVTHQGFAAAARRLGVAKSTLSRHVRELEEDLHVRLLERGERGFALTWEGESLVLRAQRSMAELDDIGASLRATAGPLRGPLRVAAPLLFTHLHLGRLTAGFRARSPDVVIETVLADRIGDLVADGIDVAIALGAPEQPDLVVRRLMTEEVVMVAPPSLVRARKKQKVTAAEPWPTVAPTRPQVSRTTERFAAAEMQRTWSLVDGARRFDVVARAVLRLPSKLVVRDAVLAGAGAALLPRSIVEEDLRTKRLVRIGSLPEPHTISIVHSSQRLVSPRVRAFIDYLVAELGSQR